MAYPAVSVANSILKLAKEREMNDITPMKLQKLLYLSQFWYLKNFKDILIDDNFSRWEYGPVIPSLYYELNHYKSSHIDSYIRRLQPNNNAVVFMMANEDVKAWALLNKILDIYGQYDGYKLSNLTHQDGYAWNLGHIDTVITKQDMEQAHKS